MQKHPYLIGILEDDPDFCELLVSIIEPEPELDTAFVCGTVADALSAFASRKPDLLLVDMQLPDGSGLTLVRAATAANKPSLMLTILADRKTALAAFEEGVHGYLLKDSEPDVILNGIRATLSGQGIVRPNAPAMTVVLSDLSLRSAGWRIAVFYCQKITKQNGVLWPKLAWCICSDNTLRSYGAAMDELGNRSKQEIGRWANNRVENSHLPFRRRERAVLRFRRMKSLQMFASVHASFHNHFASDRHLTDRQTYKTNRSAALVEWQSLMT